MANDVDDLRAEVRRLAAEFSDRGEPLGWFEQLYKQSEGDNTLIPWADLEPNRFFAKWAKDNHLEGNKERALVVGCGLGDDARFLHQLGFLVTAFDISPTAIEWAKRLHHDTDIEFEVRDLFDPKAEWVGGFDFVLEIYTIQPLPLSMRSDVIESIASFVAPGGKLVVVTRGRDDDEEPTILPWPMSRRDLRRFDASGLKQIEFVEMPGDEGEPDRFVVEYERPIT